MEPVVSRLAAALRRPEGALSPWIVTPDRHLVDALARTRFDAVTFDLQHGGFDIDTAALCAAAAALAGKPALARVALNDFAGAARLVDAGVAAIIAPMIDNAAQAAALVEAIKYPPVGRRSWGPGLATALLGAPGADYFAKANASTLAFAMIETREGYAALDAILAIRVSAAWSASRRGADTDRGTREDPWQVRGALLLRRRRRQGGACARLQAAHDLDRPRTAVRRGRSADRDGARVIPLICKSRMRSAQCACAANAAPSRGRRTMANEREGHVADDVKTLHAMGYAQELNRRMGGFQNFAVSFSLICILSGGLASFNVAMSTTGPWGATVGWIIGGVFALIVAASLGQIASAYPTAGSLYHWSSILGGRLWGWLTALTNLLGLLFVIPAVNVICYGFIRDLFFGGILGWDVSQWDNNAVYFNTQAAWVAALSIAQALLGHYALKLSTHLLDWCGYLIFGVTILFVIMLIVANPHPSLSGAFAFVNTTGDPGGGVAPAYGAFIAILMGFLYPLFTITGFDASAHVSEETVAARSTVHSGMMHAVFWSLLFGFVLALAMVIALPAVYAALAADPKQTALSADAMKALAAVEGGVKPADMAILGAGSFSVLFNTLILPTFLGKVVAVLLIAINFLCALAGMTSASRMVYAFARDGGLPFSRYLGSVSPKFTTPAHAIWFVQILGIVLTIVTTPLNAFVALSTGSAMYLYMSYAMPTIAGLLAEGKTWTKFGTFRLGAFSKPFAVIVAIGVLLIMVGGHAFVPSQLATAGDPNANPPVAATPFVPGLWYYTVGFYVLLAIFWLAIENRRFQGPPVTEEAIAKRQAAIAAREAALGPAR
jgi:amino acid transporter